MNDEKDDAFEGPHVSTHFGKRLAERADIREGASVLDLGMGLGSSLFPAAERGGDTGQIIGIDISEERVKGTYEKIKERGITNVQVIQTDARNLVFKDGTFDVLLSGFSYIYSTLEEIRRVLKEGGKFGLTTWDTLEDMEWMAESLRKYMPVDSKDVYHQDTPEELRTLLKEAGFRDVTVLTERKEFAYANEEHWWKDVCDSGWRSHLKKIEDMGWNLEDFKKETFKGLQKYRRAHGIPFNVSVRFAFGIK